VYDVDVISYVYVFSEVYVWICCVTLDRIMWMNMKWYANCSIVCRCEL